MPIMSQVYAYSLASLSRFCAYGVLRVNMDICTVLLNVHVREMLQTLFSLQIIGVFLTMRYRNQKDPYANPNAFL